MYAERFDRLFARGRDAVLGGRHDREAPPVDGSARFGVSVVLGVDPSLADRLDVLTRQAVEMAGGSHWPTGSTVSAHFTVRSLEAHRTPIAPDDAAIARYGIALRKAAGTISGPIRFAITGLTLTPTSVMACALPLDSAADDLAAALAGALGEDGWHEASFNRDIWYVNLVHFVGPIPDPVALVDWVSQRRQLDVGVTTAPTVELMRWEFNGAQVVPVRLVTLSL
jgi:hypothetical protein